jgi:hypothetical protein
MSAVREAAKPIGRDESAPHRSHGEQNVKYPGQKLAYAGAAAVAAVSILGGTLVSAQQSTPSTPTTPSTQQAQTPNADTVAYMTSLAGNLGIPLSTLNAAITKTNLAQIDAKLAAGTITAEQAAAMKTRISAETQPMPMFGGRGGPGGGGPEGRGGPGGPGGPGGFGVHEDASALATFLGITPEVLRSEQQSGKTLAEIASAHGKTRDDLKTYLTTEAKTRLTAEVTAGKLTQAQADAKLAELTANIDARIDAKPGVGGPGGPRGMRPAGAAPMTPSTTN